MTLRSFFSAIITVDNKKILEIEQSFENTKFKAIKPKSAFDYDMSTFIPRSFFAKHKII